MNVFKVHTGIAAPLVRDNIDTDAIVPSQEMSRVSKEGLGESLFAHWRFVYDNGKRGAERADFVLNQQAFRKASVLLGGANFGCGSSREYAVWALADFGVRALIAPSFGTIFYSNCLKNGVLPVRLDAQAVGRLAGYVAFDPGARQVTVDLVRRQVRAGAQLRFAFEIDADARERLLRGMDDIAETLGYAQDLAAFKRRDRAARPWAALAASAKPQ